MYPWKTQVHMCESRECTHQSMGADAQVCAGEHVPPSADAFTPAAAAPPPLSQRPLVRACGRARARVRMLVCAPRRVRTPRRSRAHLRHSRARMHVHRRRSLMSRHYSVRYAVNRALARTWSRCMYLSRSRYILPGMPGMHTNASVNRDRVVRVRITGTGRRLPAAHWQLDLKRLPPGGPASGWQPAREPRSRCPSPSQ
jgi:hypothetical protein